ncbi:undecaprenyl-phosphate glucose phosphotransferase [Winogradskyella maritima]|uniref:Undecaprenyl-phosphate glucose phosphotransferase n=1 Tax=Winogradskyella maritima TaxID=1517766 RepID=A0ABV8AEW7_9FLAO|nr:undecaprenyl-phosphate glucose phosphotransferase [Winogradskyella maritima]
MNLFNQGRYSGFLRPIAYMIDLIIINAVSYLYFENFIDVLSFISISSVIWITLSIYTQFYQVYRYTKEVKIASLIFKQCLYFTVLVYAYLGLTRIYSFEHSYLFSYISVVFSSIALTKLSFFYFLQKYRIAYGGNFRKIVIVGKNKRSKDLEKLFNNKPEYGYIHVKTFDANTESGFNLDEFSEYVFNERIDQIYCSLSEISNKQMSELIAFADNNLKVLKFIPDNKQIYSRRLKYQYYDFIPILWLRNIPLEQPLKQLVKRTFDVVFSSVVIVLILSWLIPLIAILIKLESRGPIFFKQQRNGFNNTKFYCFKFRSMTVNSIADKEQATKGDSRITKVGKFIRKTSIDELPQFFNVFFGDMSVVGPRPHMLSHTTTYAKKVDKFMVRLFVKPGITGLAQVKGFRGEIETDKDIIGRVKYDIFYVENWSLFLDIKIIISTIVNAIRGEEKAY